MKVIVLTSFFCISLQIDDKSDKPDKLIEVVSTFNSSDDYSLQSLKQLCRQELNLEHYLFDELENGIDYRNYLNCYWKKAKLLDDHNAINFHELAKLINYAVKITIDASDVPLLNTQIIATKIVNECKYVNGPNHGKKAVQMRNCLFGRLLQQRNAERDWDDFEDIPNLDYIEEDCVNELNLDGLLIEDINRYYIVPENVTEFNEFLGCYWKKVNFMGKDGHFNTSSLLLKLDEAIEREVLARSRIVYLSDIFTESIIDGCKEIKGSSNGELVLNIQNYILRRLPYFKVVI